MNLIPFVKHGKICVTENGPSNHKWGSSGPRIYPHNWTTGQLTISLLGNSPNIYEILYNQDLNRP